MQLKRFYIIVISNSHPSWRKTGILVMLFSISKTKSRSWQSFFYTKNEYNKIVRSTDYLNWCKVLYVYADIILTVCCISFTKSNTRMGYGRCSRFFKDTSKAAVNCSSTLDKKFSDSIAIFNKQVNIRCSISRPRFTQS